MYSRVYARVWDYNRAYNWLITDHQFYTLVRNVIILHLKHNLNCEEILIRPYVAFA